MTVNINPSVAWKINEMFSVGAGINAMYIDAELTNAVDYSAIAARDGRSAPALGALAVPGCARARSPASRRAAAARTARVSRTVKADDWVVGLEPRRDDQPLAEYPRRPRVPLDVKQKLERRRELREPPDDGGVRTAVAEQRRQRRRSSCPTRSRSRVVALDGPLAVPCRLHLDRLGLDPGPVRLPSGTGAAACTSTALNFKNSWRAGLGVNYQLNPEWKLAVGIAYDTTPVQDVFRTPRLPDRNARWLSLSAPSGRSPSSLRSTSATPPFVNDASSNLPSFETNQPSGFTPTPKGNLFGTYKANVNILGIQGRFNF